MDTRFVFRGFFILGIFLNLHLQGLGYCGPAIIYPKDNTEYIKVLSNFPKEIADLLDKKRNKAKSYNSKDVASLLLTPPIDTSESLETIAGILFYWNDTHLAVPYKSHFFLEEYLQKFILWKKHFPAPVFGKNVSDLNVYCYECSEVFEELDMLLSGSEW